MSFFLLSSCKGNNVYVPIVKKSINYQAIVKEISQGGNYTYLFVNSDDQNYWIAAGKIVVKIGETVYYKSPLLMQKFKSEELDMLFD